MSSPVNYQDFRTCLQLTFTRPEVQQIMVLEHLTCLVINSHKPIKVLKIIVYLLYTEHQGEKNASCVFWMKYYTIRLPAPGQ